jgi:hypothetical protein
LRATGCESPAIDQHRDAAQEGPAKVAISDSGVLLEIDVSRVDTRFHGHLSLHYKTSIPDDVLTALPTRSLAFAVSPEYVFHMLGVRVRN